MACGNTFVDREQHLFGGEAYNKVYALQESMDYYGILCDPSIAEYLTKNRECKKNTMAYIKNFFLMLSTILKLRVAINPLLQAKD